MVISKRLVPFIIDFYDLSTPLVFLFVPGEGLVVCLLVVFVIIICKILKPNPGPEPKTYSNPKI